ncbi:MAG: AMP-binding protein [Thermincola sp.]|jgi:fatty-acyl-CoA synthase|nr:AMP-binding protein [Thermincola sp.]MDT3704925.1 AMP-binding protein [Thermincola sp.]
MNTVSVRNLGDLLDQTAAEHAARDAVIFQGRRLNYAEVQGKTNQLAKTLLSLGVQPGDKVAIWITNRPEWVFSEFAIAKVGGIIVPMYTRLGLADVEFILKQSDCKVLIMMDSFLKHNYVDMLYGMCPEIKTCPPGEELQVAKLPFLRRVICLSTKGEKYPGTIDFSEALQIGLDTKSDQDLAARQGGVSPEMVVNIPFTSGTTGHPKGVMTTHGQYLEELQGQGDNWQITCEDRFMGNNPLCFNLGNMTHLMLAVKYGASIILTELFEPGEALRLIQEERCTVLSGFATVFLMLLEHPEAGNYDTSSLRTGLIALPNISDPVSLVRRVQDKLRMSGITAAYGMTENTGCTSMTRIGDSPETIANTVGRPLPGVEVKVIDPQTGKDLPRGEEGELCTRGFLVLKGYFKMPEETAKKIDSDGWFHTGDFAVINENSYISIKGRLLDMIKSGGISVYPGEIEKFISGYPGVKEVQVVGIPDSRRGEVPAAFVQQENPEAAITSEEILNFCRGMIADYKIPRYIFFVNEFPLSSLGKVQKFKLREAAAEQLNNQ